MIVRFILFLEEAPLVKLQYDLTSGRVMPQVAAFVAPLVVSDLLQCLYNAVDAFFVGRYAGTASLAAVSLCGPIMTVLVIVLSGLSSGVSVVISNYKGAGNQASVHHTGSSAIMLYGLIAVVVTTLGLVFVKQILMIVKTPPEAFPEAVRYLRIILCGFVFSAGFSLIGAMQRGLGDSKSSMGFVVVSSFVNIVLDIVLVGGLRLGAWGAALGTVIAQAVAFVIGIVHFRRQDHIISFSPRKIRFYKTELHAVLRIGLPTALNEVFVTIAMLTVSGVANSFGVAASAAYGAGRQIDNIACITDGAMNQAMASYASQNVGSGKPERALEGLKSALLLSGCFTICYSPFVYIFAPQLAAIFDPNPAVVELAAAYLRISVFSHVFFALVGPIIGFIRGTGNQTISIVVGLIAQYAFRVPTALIAATLIGFPGVGLAVIAGPLSSVTMYSIVVATGLWKKGLGTLERASSA